MRRLFLIFSLLFALSVWAQTPPWTGIIDPSRAIDWSGAGAGTIPTRTTVCNGGVPLTSSALITDINAAITNCPVGQVVSLAAGTYYLGGMPPPAVTLTYHGTPASTHYNYTVVGTNVYGTVRTTGVPTVTGPATLNGSNYFTITMAAWTTPSPAIPVGSCTVYRTLGGPSQGIIGTFANCASGGVLNDTGLSATAGSPPAATPGGIVMKSGVTLRGAGPDHTFLMFSGQSSCGGIASLICLWNGSQNYDLAACVQPGAACSLNWTANYTPGTTSIVTDKAPPLGSLLVLDQANELTDPGTHYTCDVSFTCVPGTGVAQGRVVNSVTYAHTQTVTVTCVLGTGGSGCTGTGTAPYTVTISSPLYAQDWRSGQTPGGWWVGVPITGVGIENLSTDSSSTLGAFSGVGFVNASQCWVKNIRSLFGNRNHVWLYQSTHNTIRDSYFYYQNGVAGPVSYTVEFWLASDNLLENNIMDYTIASAIVGTAQGNVISYNAVPHGFTNSILQPTFAVGHDAGSMYNLWEGNTGAQFWHDTFHGTGGLLTAHRNRATGINAGATNATYPVNLYAGVRMDNFIGNVLGTSGQHTVYETCKTSPGCSDTNLLHSVYVLGYPGFTDIGDNGGVKTITPTNFGSGYTNATVSFTGGGGSYLAATANITSGGPVTVGPNQAGSGANSGGGTAWTNPGNIAGGGSTSVTLPTATNSKNLQATNFGFSIPSNATISGISATFTRGAATNVIDAYIILLKAGATAGVDHSIGTQWDGSPHTYGGVSDLWGTTWTYSDINNNGFGIQIQVTNPGVGTRTPAASALTITVTYSVVGQVTSYTVTNMGLQYTSAPNVVITGDGTGAAATANVTYNVYDRLDRDTMFRWGNYDTAHSAVQWNSAEVPTSLANCTICSQAITYSNAIPANHTLPASFYLASKPSWWGSVPWPAIGPDVTGGNGPGGYSYNTPAMNCYLNSPADSNYPTPGAILFNANNCYGVSPLPTISPASIAFGTVMQGTSSGPQTVTLTNNSGVTITLTGTSLTGSYPTEFSLSSNTCNSGTVTNGSTCTVNVQFNPTQPPGTNESATLNISYSGSSGSPLTVSLSGTSGVIVNPPVNSQKAILLGALNVSGAVQVSGN